MTGQVVGKTGEMATLCAENARTVGYWSCSQVLKLSYVILLSFLLYSVAQNRQVIFRGSRYA